MAAIDIEFEGLKELSTALNRIQLTHPDMRRDVNKIIAHVLKEARKTVERDAKGIVGTGYPNSAGDPRDAYRAVRYAVYKRIFGGQVNILNRRKNNGKMSIYQPARKLRPGQRGGNRMKRTDRTNQVDSYYGSDRGFILRFINGGADRTSGDKMAGSRSHTIRPANRGKIAARNWFGSSSTQAMDKAAADLEALISRAIYEVWGDDAVNANII